MNYLNEYIDGKLSEDEIRNLLAPEAFDGEHERFGLLRGEFSDYRAGTRSMSFYAFKRKYNRSIFKLWPGCYVKFAFQYDLGEPHFEFGWVDVVDTRAGLARIQCDDNYQGNRALTVKIVDIMEILPYKERPLVYYKTMVCGDCSKCRKEENSFPTDCPQFNFFNAILNKQIGDGKFMELYRGVENVIDKSD